MNVLLMRLAAPMQSWGSRSRFSERDTEREPTKSGVIGLVCAALGKPRHEQPGHSDERPALAQLAALRMGVRVDREGVIRRDFHTAGGGRWLGRPYGVAKADGKTPEKIKGEFTVISNRYYLSDAAFLVGFEGQDVSLLGQIDRALGAPVWPPFLGRKAFVPAAPVRVPGGLLRGTSLEEALRSYPPIEEREPTRRAPDSSERLRLVLECSPDDGGEPRVDVPLSFELGARRHSVRWIREEWVPRRELGEEAAQCT